LKLTKSLSLKLVFSHNQNIQKSFLLNIHECLSYECIQVSKEACYILKTMHEFKALGAEEAAICAFGDC
jgi:hypothetical protein